MTESLFSDSKCAQLNDFASAVWGNSGAVLKRSGDIEFIDLERYPVFRPLFPGPVWYDKILVREEYRIALEGLETEMYYYGAYVTGQPGIGKTLFLIYLLVACLGQKRPVALQFPDGRPYYALFHDSVSFHPLSDRKALAEFPYLWALTDSNCDVRIPSPTFQGIPEKIRVIQTTAPERFRWKGWSKQTGAVGYVMDIWSENEIVDLAQLLGLDAERMSFLAKHWGCVPRTLLEFIHRKTDDSKIEALYKRCALGAIPKCRETLCAIRLNDHVHDSLSRIFFYRPLISEFGIVRMLSRATVPTPTICRLLGEALQCQTNNIKENFFLVLRGSSDTSQAADIIFENWFHSFFSAGKTIQCNWVQGTGDVSLRGPTTLVPVIWGSVNVVQPPYLWIAPKGFPGIDSALVLDRKIYVFQLVTISSTDKSPTEGMQTLRNNLPTELKKIPWRVVFVGDHVDMISTVAKKWVDKIFFPRKRVPIAWSVVDPVDPSITYKEFREELGESDDAMEAV